MTGEVKIQVDVAGESFTVACSRKRLEAFWRKAEQGRWEPDLLAFLKRRLEADMVFVDVGAWVGPASLVASRLARSVIAIEPDPRARRDLERNVALNATNIVIWDCAIDVGAGALQLRAAHGFGGSETSALEAEGETMVAPAKSFDEISAAIPDDARVAIKIDVEGHEYKLAEAIASFIQRHRAPLHLSLHPGLLMQSLARRHSSLRARFETWVATRRLVRTLARAGSLSLAENGAPFGERALFRRALIRPVQFSVTIEPRAA